MPYEDFPIDIQGEGPSLDAASILQSQHSADWANKFKNGAGKNNLMTRQRHQADVAENLATQQAAQEAYQNNEIRTNKVKQDFYFRQETLDDKRALAAVKLKHDEEIFPEKRATERARAERLLSQDREAVKKARLNEELTAQASMDSEAFMDNLRASKAKPGSQEFIDELVKNRTNFPGSAKAFNDMFRAHSGSTKDPEEFYESRKTALAAVGPNTTVTTKLPGGVTMTDRPVNAVAGLEKDRAFADKQLARALAQKSKAIGVDAVKEANAHVQEVQARLTEIDNNIKESRGTLAPAATPTAAPVERTVVNPTTGERLVLRNGAWVKP